MANAKNIFDVFSRKKPTVRELIEAIIKTQVQILSALDMNLGDLAALSKLAAQSEAVTIRLEKAAKALKALDEAQ